MKEFALTQPFTKQTAWTDLRVQIRAAERTVDKARLFWSQFAPTPADFDAVRLPAACFPAYYVLRPVRMIAKQIRHT